MLCTENWEPLTTLALGLRPTLNFLTSTKLMQIYQVFSPAVHPVGCLCLSLSADSLVSMIRLEP